MVGFNPHSQFELSTLDYSVAGVVSGVVTRCVCQPLDVLKIRFQLQVDPIKKRRGKYHGMTQASRLILREEGVQALWKGHIPAQGLSVIFGVVQFGSFEILTRYAWQMFPQTFTANYFPFVNFACGSLSGALAMTAALPMDVIRTRFVAQGEPKFYRSMPHACSEMLHREGVFAFYRGFVPTIVQIAPFTGFQFCFYTVLVRVWDKMLRQIDAQSESHIGALESLVCGSCAGTGAKMAVYPLDLMKKRLQMIGFEKMRGNFGTVKQYHGLLHLTRSILKHEGIVGMFKGLVPSLVKAAVASGIGFLSYEQMCVLLRVHKERQFSPTTPQS